MMDWVWSERAQRLLARAMRQHAEAKPLRFSGWLARQDLPLTGALSAFLDQIDGLTYEVRGEGRAMHFALNTELITDAAGHPYIACGERDATPFTFYVGTDGRLAVADAGIGPIIIASSAAKYIEADAVLDGLIDVQSAWRWILAGEFAADDRRVDERVALPLIAEASDAYTRW